MILALSTSSPWTSVALVTASGEVVKSGRLLLPMHASEACMQIFATLDLDLSAIDLFAADLGPGSFSGVRVGVTIAKTLAFSRGKQTAGVASFELIDPSGNVAVPSKRNEYFVRRLGEEAIRTDSRPPIDLIGYGPWFEGHETFPSAERFAGLALQPVKPEALLPEYLIEPSISQPKKPYAGGAIG